MQNEIRDKIINFFKHPLIIIIIVCTLFQLIIYSTVPKYETTSDSFSYTPGLESSIENHRTPVYPFLIDLIRKIVGEEKLLDSISCVQKCLFILTLIMFYYCIKSATKNKKIIIILSLIFGISPFIILWNVMILTEALSLFEITLLAFVTLKFLKKPNFVLAGSTRNNNIGNDSD